MLQIILLLVVAGVAAYFIATSRKSKVEETIKKTKPSVNPTFDPVYHAQPESETIPVKSKAIASVQQIEELKEAKKVLKKKAAPKKKATK
jgi:ABC-type cobalt transport system substrate-binding protein